MQIKNSFQQLAQPFSILFHTSISMHDATADDFISYFGKTFKVIDIRFPQIPSCLFPVAAQVHPPLHLEVSL